MDIYVGKNIDDAIISAVKELGVDGKEDLKVTILSEGTKGFFGIGAKEARIEAEVIYNHEKIAVKFLQSVLEAMELQAEVKVVKNESGNLELDIVGENLGTIIGKRGQTLDSIQYLTSLTVNKGEAQFCNIVLDCENYREKRVKALQKLAKNLAKKVRSTKKDAVLEPMSSYERRIIHSALQNEKDVETYSEGKNSNRHIVISLKK